jgi:hypothetical protein
MNSSICHADATTHLKIVATALLASVLVVWIAIATHISSRPTTTLAVAKPGPSMLAAVAGGRI